MHMQFISIKAVGWSPCCLLDVGIIMKQSLSNHCWIVL